MIRERLNPLDDVLDVKISVADKTASVQHKAALSPDQLVQILNELHMGAALKDVGSLAVQQPWGWRDWLRASTWVAQLVLFGFGLYLDAGSPVEEVSFWGSLAYVVCLVLSWALFYKAWLAVLRGKPNVEFLMVIAMLGSLLQSELMEAAMVGTLVTIMDTVTWASVQAVEKRLNRSITAPPDTVYLKQGQRIKVSDLQVGTVFVVRAGESIVADGTVVSGSGSVNESRVTGEAVPVSKDAGCSVRGGSILQAGFLEIRADAPADSSYQSRIEAAVKEAKNTQSNTEIMVEKFAVWYTPAVILLAAAIACAQESFKQFLVIIVAGCPCAILGAAPFAQASCLAVLAQRHSFLVKETAALEALARLRRLGVDKTGTITTGRFQLVKMKAVGEWSMQDLHRWAASLEMRDNHPLAHSLVESYTGCVAEFRGWNDMPRVTQFRREGRFGVSGMVGSMPVGVGNRDFLTHMDISLTGEAATLYDEWSAEGTVLFITVDDCIGAALLMKDTLRPDAHGTIRSLQKLGIEAWLLTGDKGAAAQDAARGAGISEVYSGMLPEDKASVILRASRDSAEGTAATTDAENGLLDKRGNVPVGFIGDGLNDCLALANAHVGIVMQTVGPQATVDAASAVLQGDLGQLPAAVVVARRTQRLVFANIMLAVVMNLVVILAAALVGVPLWLSVLADNGTLLLVLANSLWPFTWKVKAVTS